MTSSLRVAVAGAVLASVAPGCHREPPVSLGGSGSTFQAEFQRLAIEAFTRANPGATITYAAGGSTRGQQDLASQAVDFAGSDSVIHPDDLARCKGGDVLYFPVLLGAIAVAYQQPGLNHLQLSASTIAAIFSRRATRWNDPAIGAENPGVALPDEPVIIVHRAEPSGTTENFTRYLSEAAGAGWSLGSGATIAWPEGSEAASGNEGVAQRIKRTRGAIGYVDLGASRAAGLQHALVRNRAGLYIEPSVVSTCAAGDGIHVNDDLTFSALDARSDEAYPLSFQSWVIVYARQRQPAALRSWLRFLLTDGQKLVDVHDFAPIPSSLQGRALANLQQLRGP